MTDRTELLLADVLEAPAALARLLDAYEDPAGPLSPSGPRPARIVLTGLGSSRYAALAAESSFRVAGTGTAVEYASTRGSRTALEHPFRTANPPSEDLVLIAISASGGTREVLEAARRHQGVCRVIAVTNREDSALAGAADMVLPLFAGEERSDVATRTFRATLAVLELLARHWLIEPAGLDSLRPCVEELSQAIESRGDWLADVADRLDGAPAIDVLADAGDLGLAEQAALMLREGPRLPAVAYETADWLHTGVYLAFPGHRAVLFTGSAADREVARTIHGRGGETVVVGPSVDGAAQSIAVETAGGGVERAIVQSVVAELMAVELWRRTGGVDKDA